MAKNAVVEWGGAPVKSVKTGFRRAVQEAGLDKHVTPHMLRHTAATWLMNEGFAAWGVSKYLGMSLRILEDTYAQHHPEYQVEMVGAFRRRTGQIAGQMPGRLNEKTT